MELELVVAKTGALDKKSWSRRWSWRVDIGPLILAQYWRNIGGASTRDCSLEALGETPADLRGG